jgi:hypothetical protein
MKGKNDSRKAIERLFATKFHPVIEPSVKARDEIRATRRRLMEETESFRNRSGETAAAVLTLQAKVDEALLKGSDAGKSLHDLTVEQNRLSAYQRHLSTLADQDAEAAAAQTAAEKALAEAISTGLMNLRTDVEGMASALLSEALSVLVFFEEIGLDVGPAHGLEIDQETSRNFSRFGDLNEITFKDLLPFTQPKGIIEDSWSVIKRKEARERFLTGA